MTKKLLYHITGHWLFILLNLLVSSYACTSFAVYFDTIFYGMNFDYPDKYKLKFVIETSNDKNIFHFGYISEDGTFIPISGMNNKGFYSANQILMPKEQGVRFSEKKHNEIYTWQLHRYALSHFTRIEDIRHYLKSNKVVHMPSISLHNIVADISGNALVIEAGKDKNKLTEIQGKYIVMTNFPNHEFKNKPFEAAEGEGAERFKRAHRKIVKQKGKFTVDYCFEILEEAINSEPTNPTLCSMVFYPQNKEIYIAFNKDFNTIWKTSLINKTIETFKGFKSRKIHTVTSNGILAEDL